MVCIRTFISFIEFIIFVYIQRLYYCNNILYNYSIYRIIYTSKKVSGILLECFIFYLFGYITKFDNIMRQDVAIGLFVLSIPYAIRNNFLNSQCVIYWELDSIIQLLFVSYFIHYYNMQGKQNLFLS